MTALEEGDDDVVETPVKKIKPNDKDEVLSPSKEVTGRCVQDFGSISELVLIRPMTPLYVAL